MRTATTLVLALAAALAADSASAIMRKVGDKEMARRQLELLKLLTLADLPGSVHPPRPKRAANLQLSAAGLSQASLRGQPFSALSQPQALDAQGLFDAVDAQGLFDEFVSLSTQARDIVNEGLFVYVLSVAVVNREDAQGLQLAPPYETNPQLFAPLVARSRTKRASEKPRDEEESLSHFTEDVGLGASHTLFSYEAAPWLPKGSAPGRGGAFVRHVTHLLSRYQLERTAQSLPPVAPISDGELATGSAAKPAARSKRQDTEIIDFEVFKDVERRILDAIETGALIDSQGNKVSLRGGGGVEALGNALQGNEDSADKTAYGSLYWQLLRLADRGAAVRARRSAGGGGGALRRFETQPRDPVFYRVLARVATLVQRQQSLLPAYAREQVAVPGAAVAAVEAAPLTTRTEDFAFAARSAHQRRLAHQPFTVRVTISADEAASLLVRFFLAPHQDHRRRALSPQERARGVVLIDSFTHRVPAGESVIARSSLNFTEAAPDLFSAQELRRNAEDAIAGRAPFLRSSRNRCSGLPRRLLLPKGSREGTPLGLYVALLPSAGSASFGFPFDRPVRDEKIFALPNIFYKQLTVFHED